MIFENDDSRKSQALAAVIYPLMCGAGLAYHKKKMLVYAKNIIKDLSSDELRDVQEAVSEVLERKISLTHLLEPEDQFSDMDVTEYLHCFLKQFEDLLDSEDNIEL